MVFSRALLAGLAFSLLAIAAQAQNTTRPPRSYPLTSLGFTLGWGAPYGWGLDVRQLVGHKLELNAGLGASITGTKVGLGATYYLAPARRVSPFFGVSLARGGGRQDVRVTEAHRVFDHTFFGSEAAHVNFLAANLLHLRSGLRWQPTLRLGLLGTLGYGWVLGPNPVEYLEAPSRQSLRDAVRGLSPGGVEVSLSVAFAVGHRP